MAQNFLIIYVSFLTSLFIIGCRDDRSKEELNSRTKLCNQQLFVEQYKVTEGGAYGGDRVTDYLTDTTNFRIFIGTYISGENIYSFECKDDSVYVLLIKQLPSPAENQILSTKKYSLLDLKKQGKFE